MIRISKILGTAAGTAEETAAINEVYGEVRKIHDSRMLGYTNFILDLAHHSMDVINVGGRSDAERNIAIKAMTGILSDLEDNLEELRTKCTEKKADGFDDMKTLFTAGYGLALADYKDIANERCISGVGTLDKKEQAITRSLYIAAGVQMGGLYARLIYGGYDFLGIDETGSSSVERNDSLFSA